MEPIYWLNLFFIISFFFWIAVGQPSGREMRQWAFDKYDDIYNKIPTPSSTTVGPSPSLTTADPSTTSTTTVAPATTSTTTTTVAPATTTTTT